METLMLICIVTLLGLVIHLYSLVKEHREMLVKMVDVDCKTSENVLSIIENQNEVNQAVAQYITELEEQLSCVNVCIADLLKGEKHDT